MNIITAWHVRRYRYPRRWPPAEIPSSLIAFIFNGLSHHAARYLSRVMRFRRLDLCCATPYVRDDAGNNRISTDRRLYALTAIFPSPHAHATDTPQISMSAIILHHIGKPAAISWRASRWALNKPAELHRRRQGFAHSATKCGIMRFLDCVASRGVCRHDFLEKLLLWQNTELRLATICREQMIGR